MTTSAHRANPTRRNYGWKPLAACLFVVLLAFIPAWLVFQDRWLGYTLNLPVKIQLLLQSRLPAYFLLVFLSTLLLFAVVLSTRWETPSFFKPITYASPSPIPLLPAWQTRLGQLFLPGSIFLAAASYLLSLYTGQVLGAGFFLALSLYILAWLLQEIPFGQTIARVWRDRSILLRYLFFQFSLIFLLRCLAFPSTWLGFAALLILAACLLLLPDLQRIPLSLWLSNLALVLLSLQINHWVSSVVYDETPFFDAALDILHRQTPSIRLAHIFDGAFPYLSSLLQAASLRFLGQDIFGLRISSVFFSAASVGLFYEFFKRFLIKPLPLIAAILLAGSSYLMTFGKIGYNNTQALFAMALILVTAGWAVETDRPLAYVSLGLGIGFCFYIHPVALYLPVLGLLFLSMLRFPRSWKALRGWLFAAVTALLIILPTFLQTDYWQIRMTGLVFNSPVLLLDFPTLAGHLAANALQAFYSFLYVVGESHFVAAAFLDPISAAFLLIGLAFSLRFFRHEPFARFLTASFFIFLFLVGATHDRASPPISRMFLLLPWFCLFAAIGIYWLVEQIKAANLFQRWQKFLYPVLVGCILLANLYQANPLSWQRSTAWQLPETAFVHLLQQLRRSQHSAPDPYEITILSPPLWQIDHFRQAKTLQTIPDAQIALDQLTLEKAQLPPDLARWRSANQIFLLHPNMKAEWMAALAPQFAALGLQPCHIRDYPNDAVLLNAWLSLALASKFDFCH